MTQASVRRGSGWVLTGNLAYAACQYGVLVAVARFGSAADVGLFALGLAVGAPITILTNLHLRAVLATDARQEHPFGAYLALRLLGALVAVAAIAVVCGVSGWGGATVVVVLLVGLAKAVESVSDVVYGLLQRGERFRRIAVSMIAKGCGTLVVVAMLLHFTGSLAVATLGMVISWTALLVAIDLPAARRLASLRPETRLRMLSSLAWLALPMGIVMCFASLGANVPRYAIEAQQGQAALGYFAAMVYLTVAATQPSIALGVAASPRLAAAFMRSREEYRVLSRRFLAQAFVLGLAALVGIGTLGPWLIAVAYGPEYAAHADVLRWLAVTTALSFVTSALGYAVTAARQFRTQLAIAVVTLAVCTGASHAFIPTHGLLGAAWAMLAAEGGRLVCLGTAYGRLLRVVPSEGALVDEVVEETRRGITAAI